MKRISALIFVASILMMCSEDTVNKKGCSTRAIVRNYTGLDGCGYVFELEDGTRLEPIRVLFCGTPPVPKEQLEDPLYNFLPIDGKEVLIDYEISTSPSICMLGQTVRITCLTEISSAEGER